MGGKRIWRHLAALGILAMLALAGARPGLAADTVESLNQQAVELHGQGKYKEAVAIAEKTLALAQRTLGADDPKTLIAVNNLGFFYQAQGRYGEAEPLLKRAFAGKERVHGPKDPSTLQSIGNLAGLYADQGRYSEAEPLYKRELAGYEQTLGPEHPDTLRSIGNLGLLYTEQGRYGDAEPLYLRALASRERGSGPEHPDTLTVVNNLAMLYKEQGRYAQAEPLLKRVLASNERTLGPDHPDTLRIVNNLGPLYNTQSRSEEAEPLYRRALAGYERVLGPEHPETLISVNNLAVLYKEQGRYGEAEPLLKRALASTERVLGPDHPDTLGRINNLATLYKAQERYGEAEQLLKSALAGLQRTLGATHLRTLPIVNNLALVYSDQGRHDEAEPLLRQVLAGREQVLGPDHPDTLSTMDDLAMEYVWQSRHAEAEPLLKRALASYERILGPQHPDTLGVMDNLARTYFDQSDWSNAAAFWRRSLAATAARIRRGSTAAVQPLRGKRKGEAERKSWQIWSLIKATYRLAPKGQTPDAPASREMFQAAQWARSSEVAQSLAQMAARNARGDGALARLVRERQDLVAEWQRRETARNAAFGQDTAKRDGKAEAENNDRMAAIDARIAPLDKQLATAFPDYAALVSPLPLSVEDVQALLAEDEALVLFLDLPNQFPTLEETFIWVVTKTDMRWVRSTVGTAELTREVQALRCGLDYTAWANNRCKELTDAPLARAAYFAGEPLPFDHARALRLYKTLFGKIEDLIKGKQLLLVPSGPLTQLPFHVLVSARSPKGDHRSTAWLARQHAITVLPAISSLKALRQVGRPSAAAKPLMGFGNPLLDGQDDEGVELAKRARKKQSCPRPLSQRVAELFGAQGETLPVKTRGSLADVSVLRSQTSLPETADELCAVARAVGADFDDIRLGARATEREVKAASERGELAEHRVVHFATHGLMAGQLRRGSEPGLILTPPAQASEEDDGYLTASEISALKLDADWVILSACNTAAGDSASAETLSGLARAFIYAQTRALLVSHWEVDSNATVKLITSSMREFAGDKTIGRAEALRRAMLALIDKGDPQEAHPAYWAPFVLVGEGRR
jgi:CHAT domain-containing protein/tetratricopeptide (TPR) repeat protein